MDWFDDPNERSSTSYPNSMWDAAIHCHAQVSGGALCLLPRRTDRDSIYCHRHYTRPEYQCQAILGGRKSGTQCRRTRTAGSKYCGHHYTYAANTERETTMNNKRAQLEAQIRAAGNSMSFAQLELERLDSLPKEPAPLEDGTYLIFFRKKFRYDGLSYSYSATRVYLGPSNRYGKAAGEYWFVSGHNNISNQPLDWESLLDWIMNGEEWEIWNCTDMDFVAAGVGEEVTEVAR